MNAVADTQKIELDFKLIWVSMTLTICSVGSYLRATGKERFDVDVGVVNFKVMVTKPTGHPDGGQHSCL